MALLSLDADRIIMRFDRMLRTLCAPAVSARPAPGSELPEAPLAQAERRRAAALMRVNHTGEVCAQALYEGQALTARSEAVREVMNQAAREEADHLAWTAARVSELGGRLSLLNPLFYGGAFALGAAAGFLGDRWNLGFLRETERQVEGHLQGHLSSFPEADRKSRAILEQMKVDEARHAATALAYGGAELPAPVRLAMRLASRLMTGTTYWI
ncbi:MAG TPA: 2-polyprenyl-3-methyl-6-methoxy-1,4-benzoquinone monooxygenase [Burkholderiales bacterium]|jgi:ubiquinone biosynthesis monooxygenase Coq7|nr:2-polyprenyl-3-methyl-6-methoxy-1,4-benzoquinone monooxygenase [Burkholderiales bacterium]